MNGKQYKVVDIGIDPGQKTGIAVKEIGSQSWVLLKTVSFWEAIELLQQIDHDFTIRQIVIEDPSQNRPVFQKHALSVSKLPQLLKIAQNVGMNKSDAIRLIEYCQRQGWTVKAIRPAKGSLTKLSAEIFKRMTGITQRTSEHSRDAAMFIA